MIPYNRDPKQIIPASSVKIIGLGGAGTNMLELIALDGMEGAELLALNTDVRTLGSCLAKEKIQLGVNLTKGLGAGGDPELGHSAVLEAEDQIRAAVKGRRIVFLCTGLGGGTGSGAAPIVTRIAREEGAFVVVFATMPFAFEGKRRRDQGEAALNELAVLSNALVTFDNNRMGELVLAKQGIHEAFVAADRMICESIKAVIRLVVRPGLINVGLDDLMSALRTNRSRCLFGSGIAKGKDRASRALRNALASPLLDQGALLKDAQTVLVHLSGGEDLTLFEIELLMQRLQKFVPDSAHVLFGAAIDPAMGDSLSLTLISALPEDSLAMAPRESLSQTSRDNSALDPSQGFTNEESGNSAPAPLPDFVEPEEPEQAAHQEETPSPTLLSKFRRSLASSNESVTTPSLFDDDRPFAEPEIPAKTKSKTKAKAAPEPEEDDFVFPKISHQDPQPVAEEPIEIVAPEAEQPASPVVVAEFTSADSLDEPCDQPLNEADTYVDAESDPPPIEHDEDFKLPSIDMPGFTPIPKKRPAGVAPWSRAKASLTHQPVTEAPPPLAEAPAHVEPQ
ncbi:MAG: hypothetical protein H8M99_13420, partial [Gloeobacteraceae cyanobacterium ES-bin-144]|nr:hypothetical protein [Verrucomicrobiales bacterium]